MVTLANDWLELEVSEADGSIRSLRLTSSGPETPVDYVEPSSLTDGSAAARWGHWEIRDSFTTHKPSDAILNVVRDGNAICARWESDDFDLSILRTLEASRLTETVTLRAKRTMVVVDFNLAFRPAVTDFLDASNVSVGEHTSFIASD